jgi:ribosomal protein L32E
VAAFKERFARNELHRWQNASSTWTRQQGEDESVDEFITAIRNLARLIPINDEERINFATIKGLKRDIKQRVLQANPKTLEDITKAARIAEVAYTSTRADNKVADLTKQVTELVEHLKKSTISSVQTARRSRSPSPRRVHFDETAKTSQGNLNADYERAEIQRSQQHQQKSENQARRGSYRPDESQKPMLTNNYRSTQPQQSTNFHWRQSQTFAKMDNRSRYLLDSHQNLSTEGEQHCGNCGVLYYFDHACRAIGKQ